jgi:2-polyprenyl-3-methyl-5-hydroxy-6-metoxy-1,4-benzoquinol methylase
MVTMSNVVEHWDREYLGRGVETPDPGDPVLNAALAHFGDVRGKRLLDLGCGTGAASLFFASHGATVTAVDISPEAVRKLREHCAGARIESVTAIEGSAFDVESLGPFELVYGSMILHHIEPFADFVRILRGSLVPEGRAFFYENSAMSQLLIWFRTHVVGRLWVPKRGDEDEFPLMPQEIDLLRTRFSVEVEYPELVFFRLISSYLLRERLTTPFRWLDDRFYAVKGMRRYSYRQYLYLTASP